MGFFDTQGEKLYKEMDRAMNDLISVNKELKEEILEKIQSLLPRLLEESARWSSEGKLKAARNLQGDAKRKRNFDVASYVSLFITGAYLEALLLPHDPHAKHVKETIEKIVSPSNSKKPESSQESLDEFQNLIASFLVLPLSLHYGRVETSLSDYIVDINLDDDEISWKIYCIAYGMIDGLAQMKGMGQMEHIAVATIFLTSKMKLSPGDATDIVGKLARIKPDSPMFRYIYNGGLAITNYCNSEELDEFFSLSELLDE